MRKNNVSPGMFFLLPALACSLGSPLSAQTEPAGWNGLTSRLPDPLAVEGKEITTAGQWTGGGRQAVLELFRTHVYGKVPSFPRTQDFRTVRYEHSALSGLAELKETEVTLSSPSGKVTYTLLLLLPAGREGPVPCFLGLNFYGNHTILDDPGIGLHRQWVPERESLGMTGHRATGASRGVRAHRWPLEKILSRGYGLATVCLADFDPDRDDGFMDGVHALAGEERDDSSWGTIAAWAWGLSRALDYLEREAGVDAGRVAVIGHSRLGKAALWAGASDPRFAMVVSNNSGCGGAALSRRPVGESVEAINTRFPHWFARRFHSYNKNVGDLPVDQHMLLSLMAPRPLYVASAAEDEWADPYGEYLSVHFAGPVYRLFGEPGMESVQHPEADRPRGSGRLGYHVRSGSHDLTAYDWEQYLDFADRHLKQNPGPDPADRVTMERIREHLRPESPRLILTPAVEQQLRDKLLNRDPLAVGGMNVVRESARGILDRELLEFQKSGRRLLGVSREAAGRLTSLALVCRIDRDPGCLKRLEEELDAVSAFPHWNPSHFLDVAEMAAGVALALDWAGEWISPEVEKRARTALTEMALKPGIAASENTWFTGATHNWNLVCNGGLLLAALVQFEEEPELASRVIRQAVETIPLALKPYAPGGIYPEGPSYWSYATTYLALITSASESALGTDFGFTSHPGVAESALFSRVIAGPGGEYYNFFDAGSAGYHSLRHFGLLAWFSRSTGSTVDLDACLHILEDPETVRSQLSRRRFFPVHLLDLIRVPEALNSPFPMPGAWAATGDEPLGVLRDPGPGPGGFFLAAKGGRAADNHGNMDAGSFIFELDGQRWAVDPGNQSYGELESLMGMKLWDESQDSPRWSLLTKNNFGHSTLTVDSLLHSADGRGVLERFDLRGPEPWVTFDLQPLFGTRMERALRTFRREGDVLCIADDLRFGPGASRVTWQMITTADVTPVEGGAVLLKEGSRLSLRTDSPFPFSVRVVSLDPPPLGYDKRIRGLKRVEFILDRPPGESPELYLETRIGKLQ